VTDEQKQVIKYVSDKLMFDIPAVEIPGEEFVLTLEGGYVFEGTTTTYTLGLMLSGMLLLDEEAS